MVNRTLCDVLEAMRQCYETRNFAYLLGLIEEAQNFGNKMEAGLYDKKDYEKVRKKVKKLKAEVEKLRKEKHKLGGEDERGEYY